MSLKGVNNSIQTPGVQTPGNTTGSPTVEAGAKLLRRDSTANISKSMATEKNSVISRPQQQNESINNDKEKISEGSVSPSRVKVFFSSVSSKIASLFKSPEPSKAEISSPLASPLKAKSIEVKANDFKVKLPEKEDGLVTALLTKPEYKEVKNAMLNFAGKEFSTENFRGFDAIQNAKKETSPAKALENAKNIYHNFVARNSPYELNLGSTARNEFINSLKELDNAFKTGAGDDVKTEKMNSLKNAFDKMESDVVKNISDTYTRFSLSPEAGNVIDSRLTAPSGDNMMDDLLNSSKLAPARKLFENFAEKEFSTENIKAFDAITDFKKAPSMEKAQAFIDNFLTRGVANEVNVSGKNNLAFKEAVQSGDLTKVSAAMDNLYKDVCHNLSDTYTRFIQTDEAVNKLDFRPLASETGIIDFMSKSEFQGARTAFAKFAEKEFSTENLSAHNDIKKFNDSPDPDKAKSFYHKYISKNAITEINISAAARKEFVNALSSGDMEKIKTAFEKVQTGIEANLNDTFSRFTSSEEAKPFFRSL